MGVPIEAHEGEVGVSCSHEGEKYFACIYVPTNIFPTIFTTTKKSDILSAREQAHEACAGHASERGCVTMEIC